MSLELAIEEEFETDTCLCFLVCSKSILLLHLLRQISEESLRMESQVLLQHGLCQASLLQQ